MKIPCKLCEMSTKLEEFGCAHRQNPFVPLGLDQANPFLAPQVKDIMLAYFLRGYYQPAGPLITVPHGHIQPQLVKGAAVSDLASHSPLPTGVHPPAPSSNGDSSDNEVIITSVTTAKDPLPPQPPPPPPPPYRFSQYHPPPHHAYSYTYPSQYYAVQPHPTAAFSHHDICYSPSPYLHHKYAPSYRRYLPSGQYYQHQELYGGPSVPANQQTQQVATANAAAVETTTFRSAGNAPTVLEPYPPAASTTLVETYPPHYYTAYGPVPPPSCFTHSPPSRTIPYINAAAYQPCPCPMQSCPKNVLTGPLTGDSKRSSSISIAKQSIPLPPVASLALPLEPASATGPPSPARGSAGMPPPPSPAGATYRSGITTPKLERDECGKRSGGGENTMLLMCRKEEELVTVKREVESPEEAAKKEPTVREEDTYNVAVAANPYQKYTDKAETILKKIPEVQILKSEESEQGLNEVLPDVAVEQPANPEPCIKTVAENVKVKNMKRKLLEKETVEGENPSACAQKKSKANGSYKDLIKKHTTGVKINNGKCKLNADNIIKASTKNKAPRTKLRRVLLKQKLGPPKEDHVGKRATPSKLLTGKENKICRIKMTKAKKISSEEERTYGKSALSESCVRTVKEKPCKIERTCCAKKNCKSKNVEVKITGSCKKKKKVEVVTPSIVAKVPRKLGQCPKWSNGWIWEGEPFEAKVFINSDETIMTRKCYPRMRHKEGDLIEPRDCVLLKAGQRKNELPFVAKIAALWENPDDGEMMMSLLWYYRPEHTEQGRLPTDQPDEVFASRHKDSNSVACIEDKCYVLTFNEYCRYRKELRRLQEGIDNIPCIPILEPYPRNQRQPPNPLQTPTDLVFYCRKVYDFRQKRIMKNPS